MTSRQRIALGVGVLLFVLVGLFPPWTRVQVIAVSTVSRDALGYAFIGSGGPPILVSCRNCSNEIDLTRLFIQWSGVAALTGAAVLLLLAPVRPTLPATLHSSKTEVGDKERSGWVSMRSVAIVVTQFLGAIVVVLGFGYYRGLVRQEATGGPGEGQMTPAILSRTASDANTILPMMVNADTEWTSSMAVGATLFVNNYRLVNVALEDLTLTEDFLAEVRAELSPFLRTSCTTPETRDNFLARGVTIRYVYYDRNGSHLYASDVTPADCGFSP